MYLTWTGQPSQGFGMVSVVLMHIRISRIDVGSAVLEQVPSGWAESLCRSWLDSWVVELGMRWLTGCIVNPRDKYVDRRGAGWIYHKIEIFKNVELGMGEL